MLDVAAVARRLGVGPRTVLVYHNRAKVYRREHGIAPGSPQVPGVLPEPDAVLGTRPCWYPSTIEEYIANRPGAGTGGGRPWGTRGD
ncbi:hypothetical protein B4N89_27710 [Embleya scabrispora]|uniref:HTH merR-type domain-containing protein n=1 Tax=Embleya scabrispora TaxID=159449 RepID=A0A1T3P8K8_9ACTN|nr:hypothetical protein B4N89_27710 [Embleya scabrispora]